MCGSRMRPLRCAACVQLDLEHDSTSVTLAVYLNHKITQLPDILKSCTRLDQMHPPILTGAKKSP